MLIKRLRTWIHQQTSKIGHLLCFIIVTTIAGTVHAQERLWWFEVEVIVFKRDTDPNSLREAFPSDLPLMSTLSSIDLLTPYLTPDLSWTRDSLPYCFKPPAPPLKIGNVGFTPDSLLSAPELSINELGVMEMSAQADSTDGSVFDNEQETPLQDGTEALNEPLNHPDSYAESEADGQSVQIPEQLASRFMLFKIDTNDATDITQNRLPEIEFNPVAIKLPESLACVYEDEQLQFAPQLDEDQQPEVELYQVPQRVNGVEWLYTDNTYLLSQNSLKLTNLVNSINRQKDTNAILHMGWRQEIVFGQDKAPFYRLFAGQNFASNFAENGDKLIVVEETESVDNLLPPENEPVASEPDLIAQIKQALEDPNYQFDSPVEPDDRDIQQERVTELWQLDGLFKVFLRYIQGVPYLHIESELDYRAPVVENSQTNLETNTEQGLEDQIKLQSFRFSQLRRVISNQVHYFDHPLFGMVVQIRRFDKPVIEEELDEETQPEEVTNPE